MRVLLRFLQRVTFLVLGIAALTIIVCLLLGWTALSQVGTALFWIGALVLGMGSITLMGGPGSTQGFDYFYPMSASDSDMDRHTRQLLRDKWASYRFFILLGAVGLILLLTGSILQEIGRTTV